MDGLNKNPNDGNLSQNDQTYFDVSATRTAKRSATTSATAVTEWSRPTAASTSGDWVELPIDTDFLVALAWKADD